MKSHACSWCGRPLVPYLPAIRMVRMPKYRELAAHLVAGCAPCIEAVISGARGRMCTEGQVLMAAACRSSPHRSTC